MKARLIRSGVALAFVLLCGSIPALRAQSDPIAMGALQIQGRRLTLYSDSQTTDADQTINVGESARVRTCFGGGDACGAFLPGDPRVSGMVVRAELRGPELPQPVSFETTPGAAFVLPGFQQEGDYRLENIRLVDQTSGQTLAPAEPATAVLHVRRILLASATVRTMSLEELKAKGITFSAENFQAFNFAVGFAFGDEIVKFDLPIAYSGYGSLQPLSKPEVDLDQLPANLVHTVERWQPPSIVPFKLEVSQPELQQARTEEDEELTLPLFGVIVIPGNVSYLNQFFEAKLVVANGAPAGTNARLEELEVTLRLPPSNVLRVVGSDPAVWPGQPVPILGDGAARGLYPGEQGTASWTVEGLVAGSHTLQMDISGTLARAGRVPLPLLSHVQAAVEVVDARFNLTFSHPDVVREGEAYSLFVTVSNLSRAAQNVITVDLDEAHVTGAHAETSGDPLRQTIQTLAPGQSETLEFRLIADLDGKVVATTFQSSSAAGQGTIRLRTGVGELGIPLSPATLILPRFSERLRKPYLPNDDLHRAYVRFLGLAHSLAVAPPALTPPGLPRVIRSDVERRAIDFAQAGMRTFLHEQLLESLEVLALDVLGNRAPLAEIDALRRATNKGLAVGTEIAALLRAQQQARRLSAAELFDEFSATTTYTAPYVAGVLLPATSSGDLALEIQGQVDGAAGLLRGAVDQGSAVRTLPYGELFRVLATPEGASTTDLVVIGHVALDQEVRAIVRNRGAQASSGRLLLVVPSADGSEDRRIETQAITVPPGGTVSMTVGARVTNPEVVDAGGASLGVGLSHSQIVRPPFRIVGAVQDFRLNEEGPSPLGNWFRPNRYGNGVVYLFNRPPEKAAAVDAENYRVRSTFSGLDTSGKAASGDVTKLGTGAWVQDDERVVAVRYATPISALRDPANGQPLVNHTSLLDTAALTDRWGSRLEVDQQPPSIESDPLHTGALLTGKVVRGTGEPVAGARVQLIRPLVWHTLADDVVKLDFLGEVTTGSDGSFYFDFIENPHWDKAVLSSFTLRATIPAGTDPALQPAETQEVSATIRLQNRLSRINIALLGRGTLRGRVTYSDTGETVGGAEVRAVSTLFGEQKVVHSGSDGTFEIPGLPVGPITISARDAEHRVVYATVGLAKPGDTVEVSLRLQRFIPGLGTVTGTVVGAKDGNPIAGTRVAVYAQGAPVGEVIADGFGRFRFDQVPEGQVSLQAANWAISRVSIFTDLLLAAGETKDVTLRLPDGATHAVTGSVLFHDPITNTNVPIPGAVAFIAGPGVFAYTDAAGRYRIEGVPAQSGAGNYSVHAIDFARQLEGTVELPPILDVSPDEVAAQGIVLAPMAGGIDGVVLDPLGRPLGGAAVELFPYGTKTAAADGSFSYDNLPIGSYAVTAHIGDGLAAGRVGYIGDAAVSIAYGGHRPFVAVRMRGAGAVNVWTHTRTSTGDQSIVYYKPTYYSELEYRLRKKGAFIEAGTDPNGRLSLALPVGPYEIDVYNPFHGVRTIQGNIGYAGQVIDHDIEFQDAATVAGQVVGIDGVTPAPDVEVVLDATGLKGQTQRTDASGNFRFELVPMGRVIITATGSVAGVDRVGRTIGSVTTPGQTLDLTVQMKAQGTVAGRAVENYNGVLRPLANAYYYLQEDSFPYRRIPAGDAWFSTDSQGQYQVPHVYVGGVTAVVRDSGQVGRSSSVRGTLSFDWQVLQLADVVMTTSVGALQVGVRDPVTGGPVADAQVRLSNGEATVTDQDGVAYFDALPLGVYSVYAFNAPTGQSGRLSSVTLASPGQLIARILYLDQRGDVRGTLWDDLAKTLRVKGGTVRLDGETAGGRVSALATTSDAPGSEGRFEFQGIPEGSFVLNAVHPTSPRRASATAAITATSPIAEVDMVLEAVGDVYFRLFEKRKLGPAPTDLASSLFSMRLVQDRGAYDFAQLEPAVGDLFRFPSVLIARSGSISAEELAGERRTSGASFSNFTGNAPISGAGSQANPYQLVLSPKGVVRVSVRDAAGRALSGAEVTLSSAGGRFPSVTGTDGTVAFAAVPAGALNVSARLLGNGTSGYATGSLTYDDDVIDMTVALSPAVFAHGVIYQPVAGDTWNGDSSLLVPAPGILVQLSDAKAHVQSMLTDERGEYRFGGLATGGFSLTARSNNGDQQGALSGSLLGPDGNDNQIAALILDASPPRLVSVAPPPGLDGVSRTAAVELVFSEALANAVVPVNSANPTAYFALRSAGGTWASGLWNGTIDASGRAVVRFVPSAPYENSTLYSLTVAGGPGGVRDRAGRPLTTSGNLGSNFKTSDTLGPAVIATDPDLGRPVAPDRPLRFDFNEALHATDEQLDGDLAGDAVELYWQHGENGVLEWRRLPVVSYLTRSNYSLSVQAVQGVSLPGDTLRRRIVLTGLTDADGNEMPAYERTFRIYDAHAPVLDAVPNPGAGPDGQLLQGSRYTLLPILSGLDDVSGAAPGGDIDRVDYFYEDPSDPSRPVSPAYSSKAYPFTYSFVAAYVGNNVDPRPFPLWVRAFDTSTNKSNVVRVGMVVLPNTNPTIETVNVAATAPVPGVPYAGSTLLATVSGFQDPDGSQLTLFGELWQEGASSPIAATNGQVVNRPANGWNDAPSQTFSFTLPAAVAEGTRLFVRARAKDASAAVGVRESERLEVADDTQPPQISDFSVRLAGAPVTSLFIGEQFYFELRARDVETAIANDSVSLTVDRPELVPGQLTLKPVAGFADLYRSATFTVPVGVAAPTALVATASLTDFGGNAISRATSFQFGPERDPYAPQARWQLPWQGALWPANYVSTVSASGAALLLRFYARDTNADVDGNPIPGHLVSVELRGPVRNTSTGALELAPTWTTAGKLAGSDDIAGAVYQGLWRVPNGIAVGTEIPFETRLHDSAGTETIARVTITAAPWRQVYEGAITSVGVADTMLPSGGSEAAPVFLLDGTVLSVLPRTDGTVRRLPGLFLYAGASTDGGVFAVRPTVLTAPEITTYDSAIPFQPLELAIDQEIAVSVESRIDMSRKGLLGVTSTRSLDLPGETHAQAYAGGSHGGEGWFGSPLGGWARPSLNLPGSVYDSVRDPRLPGGGGASPNSAPGGAGGGVIRLLADSARLHLDGDVVANGGSSNGTTVVGGGGAGGAIRIAAARLEGRGRIQAKGGDGGFYNTSGGGGGGRVSLSYRELASDVDLPSRVDVSGGIDDGPVPARADRRAGAGTYFVEQQDPTTGATSRSLVLNNPLEPPVRPGLTPLPAIGSGVLASVDPSSSTVVLDIPRVRGNLIGDRVTLVAADGAGLGSFGISAQRVVADASAPAGARVALTVAAGAGELEAAAGELALGHSVAFHGESAFDTVEIGGGARLLADDDLLLGPPGSAVINDRTRVLLRRGGRALLRGESPVVSLTGVPAAGSNLLLGGSAQVTWTVSDALGLAQITVQDSAAPSAVSTSYYDESTSVSSSAVRTIQVPVAGPPSPVSFTLEARDEAGRLTRATATWPVLENAAPTGALALLVGTPTPLRAGYPFTVTVHADDRERLAKVTVSATGPVTPATQSTTTTGTSADLQFVLQVPAGADGSAPVVVQAIVDDAAGSSVPLPSLTLPVVANGAPTGTVSLAAGAPSRITAGQATTILVHADDADGLTKVDLHVALATAVTQPEQTKAVAGSSVDAAFTVTAAASAVPQNLSVTATLWDKLGNSSTTAPFLLPIVADVTKPVATIAISPDRGASGVYRSGETVSITGTATDNKAVTGLQILAGGQVLASAASSPVTAVWTVPAVASPTPVTLEVVAGDADGNEGRASRTVNTDAVPADLAPSVAFTCPATGALLPSDYTLTLQASASDDVGVARVRFYVGDATTHFAEFVPAGGPAKQIPLASTTFNLATLSDATVRFRVEATDTLGQSTAQTISVQRVAVTNLKADGQGANDWAALATQVVALRSGTLTVDQPRTFGGLLVLNGAVVTHSATASAATPNAVRLTVTGPVYVGCGGAIDVTGRGYAPAVTYPNHTVGRNNDSSGSHIGEGFTGGGTPFETFGSVYYPQENGSGSWYSRGGGAVLVVADRVQIDGSIRANGDRSCRGGAGGSVWIRTGALAGNGGVESKGGDPSCNGSVQSGGGGAIAVEYASLDSASTVLGHLTVLGGSGPGSGGAGSVYVKGGAASTYGQLTIDNGALTGHARTVLPSLGKGAARAGSAGSKLVTDRAKLIPGYFVGHWVEVRDASKSLKGTWRISSIGPDGLTVMLAAAGDETVSVSEGDTWQGVYRLDRFIVNGDLQIVSSDPIRVQTEQIISGNVETDAITADRLVVKTGTVLTQRLTPSSTAAESLRIDARELIVESGAAIDVTGRGYAPAVTYPAHTVGRNNDSAGSHIGEGIAVGTPFETFGSLYFPQENGSGSWFSRGGGSVRVVASRLQIDGSVRANGDRSCRGGAGGSVWVKTDVLAGSGTIEAKGGDPSCNGVVQSGGGGAIAVEYSSLEETTTLLSHLNAQGGSGPGSGGAGSIYVKGGASSTYGQLTIDNGAIGGNRRTILPSLGRGTARSGSGGATLVTDRAKSIPAYFVGDWVEVRDSVGALKGTWRIASIGSDGWTVSLSPAGTESVSVNEGDRWQGVYRLDRFSVSGDLQVLSADPIRVHSEQVISGNVESDAVSADRLVIKAGGVLAQHFTTTSDSPESLNIQVRELVVESGGAIDVSMRGYPPQMSYPGAFLGNADWNGGSHLGEGGLKAQLPWETFGSVYFPRENGSGSNWISRGGGAVRVVADRIQVDGAIRGNGQSDCSSAAGGSVWLKTGVLSGVGTIEVKGGNAACSDRGSGGGGAIAVEYGSLDAGTTLLDHLHAEGGSTGVTGGAGTAFVKNGTSTYGDLVVDNGAVIGNKKTILPSFGSGLAQSGSGGATLVTDRAKSIPAYFVGHWVEIRDDATGSLKGTWRIASIGLDGKSVTLDPSPEGGATVQEGDRWQGVYRFDHYTVRGQVQVLSADPIRVSSEQVITGTVETDAIHADRLIIKSGATLTQHLTPASENPESLTIEVRELVIESGGAIDVSMRGYAPQTSYPGAFLGNADWNGGSHLGEGGLKAVAPWETFGSVYFPRENGSGSNWVSRGGGAVRVVADRIQIDGAIRGNGQSDCSSAAGGSVWLKTAALAGTGTIEVKGGSSVCSDRGSGGGGAIAVEYSSLDQGTTLLDHLHAEGGSTAVTGGAGTVYVKGGSASTYGQLTIDNGTVGGHRKTVLPSLGKGTARPGSAGATLVTDRAKPIPAYFIGHWIEVRDALGVLKGTWRVNAIGSDGLTASLSPSGSETVSVNEGDAWQGVYRFDEYRVKGDVQVFSADPIRVYSDQVITGTFETDAIYADRLIVRSGATLNQRYTVASGSAESLNIEVRELVVESGGAIDASFRGYPPQASYPGAFLGNADWNGGSHLGEGGLKAVAPWETFGSVYLPRENGSGSNWISHGGGAIRVVADRIQVDGALRSNGQSDCSSAAGGSVWLKAGVLAGSGVVEAKGGSAVCGDRGSGGGGAIAIEYASLDASSTLLDHLHAEGGSTGITGGAGTIYLRGPNATLGSLVVSNGAVTGNRRTILPSLGRGIVQEGSSGGTVATGRDADIPAYFVGSWFEVEGQDRVVKGVWRIASISRTTVTLEPKAGQPFTVAPGDRWRGMYRFDAVTVSPGAVLVSSDPVVQLVPPLPAAPNRPRRVQVDGTEGLYGNDEAPIWDKSKVTVETGSIPGSYRVTVRPGAAYDPDGIADLKLTSGGRGLSREVTAESLAAGEAFLWAGRPGQRLQLVATDAHARFRRSGWLELPPLPDGGWAAQYSLPAGVTPLAVAGASDWTAVGDDGVWVYGAGSAPVATIAPNTKDQEILALDGDPGSLYFATRDRVDVYDRATRDTTAMPVFVGGTIDALDAGASTSGHLEVLVDDDRSADLSGLRLARLSLTEGATPEWSQPSDPALPRLAEPQFLRSDDHLHLLGFEVDPADSVESIRAVIYTWPATGGVEVAPERVEIGGGWRAVGSWHRGIVLVTGDRVALMERGATAWTESGHITAGADVLAAAASGDALVVLRPGAVEVYDIAHPDAPVLRARQEGSAYTALRPLANGQVLLWSPRMATPPVRFDATSAVSGGGFTLAIDGLP